MKRLFSILFPLALAGGLAAACDDYDVFPYDGGAAGDASTSTPDATTPVEGGGGDAAPDAAPGDGDKLLLSFNGSTQSELAVFDLKTKAIAGRLTYPGFIGTTTAKGPDPFLMQQAADRVVRLDRLQPWVARSSWNVALDDKPETGASYANPNAVLVSAGNKAYVLRYTRNKIAVIDPSQTADAGAPAGTIDLSSLLQTGDRDGAVEMTAGIYDPARRLVYVVLGNIDRLSVASDGYTILCAAPKATVIAIDVDTDKVVPLAGGTNGAIQLRGYNPLLGGLQWDAAGDRLLVLHAGCNTPGADGGAGPITQRMVEEVSLFTGSTRVLLDANSKGFPSAFVYIDQRRAVVQFNFTGFETHLWDPRETTLGALIPNAPDSFVWDGHGNIVGITTKYLSDGGVESTDIVSVRIADGKSTKLGQNPFSLPTGFLGGIEIWPPR